MNRTHFLLSLTVLAAAALSPAAWAEEDLSLVPSAELEKIMRGGQLYDHWGRVTGKPLPESSHTGIYGSESKQRGSVTWLCHECHGWDYLGAKGMYKTGAHFSGLKGIEAAQNLQTPSLLARLKSLSHRYGEHMKGEDLESLAAFVSRGQIDMNKVIDPSSGKARGEAEKGKPLYEASCLECHGPDGRKGEYLYEKTPMRLGAVANENPWMTFHRIRVGVVVTFDRAHPALLTRPVQAQVDVLAYLQTLPAK